MARSFSFLRNIAHPRSILLQTLPVVAACAVLASDLLVGLAFAQDGATVVQPPQPTAGGMFARMGVMFVVVYAIFHFLVIKPQKAKLLEQQNLIKEIKKGEQVVTNSGMIARVASVESDHISLEISPNVRVKFELGAISRKLDK